METALIKKSSRAVMIRREMIKMPEVMGVLDPVDRSIFLASIDKTIEEYSGADLSAELAIAIKWIAKDIGYRVVDEADRQYMIVRTAEILKRYYRNFTLKDFRMAFEMAITGSLDDFLPRGRDGQPDRHHYQQFNAEYVCKILNAYKARRGWVMKKANEAVPRETSSISEGEIVSARRQIKSDLINAFLQYKYRGCLPGFSPIAEMLFYDMLAKVGLADPVEISIEDQREVLRRTALEFVKRDRMYDAARIKEEGTGSKDIRHGSFVVARRRALVAAFDMIIEEEIQITDYVR